VFTTRYELNLSITQVNLKPLKGQSDAQYKHLPDGTMAVRKSPSLIQLAYVRTGIQSRYRQQQEYQPLDHDIGSPLCIHCAHTYISH
jgi:hypothetical protein